MSRKLLLQSDDFGITDGVTDGALKAIQDGCVRNTGLFVNMPSSARAAQKAKDVDVCLGIDINYVCGNPISDPALIPDLVNADGSFKSSRQILEENELESMEKGFIFHFKEDPFPYEQILLETENQVQKFIELTGKLPEYLHAHSVVTPNTEKAAAVVAAKYNLPQGSLLLQSETIRQLPGMLVVKKGVPMEEQVQASIKEDLLNASLPELKEEETGYYVFHCGYVDKDLFTRSSMTLRRMLDLEAASSQELKDYLAENDIELITYRDIKEELLAMNPHISR